MARRVYADFDSQLHVRLAKRTDISAADREQLLNDAIIGIGNEFAHPELEGTFTATVSLGSQTVTPAETDISYISFLKRTDTGREIEHKSKEEIERRDIDTGSISEYYWWGGVITFNFLADAATAIKGWYKKLPARFTTGSPVLRELYDPLIIMRAAKLGWESIGNLKKAHEQEVLFNNYIKEFKIPSHEAEKNDSRKGIQVRTR
jgi:hypothetical protein